MLKSFNRTNVVLLPKSDAPRGPEDFRPIACCSTLYKVIAKLLCSRLQLVLPTIINENQAAFVEGRCILHNVLIGQELLRLYNRKSSSPCLMMKVDIRKAYDSVSWDFLRDLLVCLCFPQKFVDWLLECVCTASYSLVVNGESLASFPGQRGLRQGDPVSPLLFVIVMEYFSRLLKRVAVHPEFRFHPGCQPLGLNCLVFADDILLFCKGHARSVQLIAEALNEFEAASGLAASPSKSRIYAGGCHPEALRTYCNVTGFSVGDFPMQYMGFPLSPRKWNRDDCWRLVEVVTARIRCWTLRHLSYAGRAMLIQSILMTMHMYWASAFIIPKRVIEEIEKQCRSFLWGSSAEQRRPSLVAWDTICSPKSQGGLGLKHLGIWNVAFIGKQVWDLKLNKEIDVLKA